jgi:hypothetical protein
MRVDFKRQRKRLESKRRFNTDADTDYADVC